MRYSPLLVAALLLGCAHSGTQVQTEDGINMAQYRRIGIVRFADRRGQGEAIADGIADGLQKLLYEPVERKTLEKILTDYKFDTRDGPGVESLVAIRTKTSADAVVIGRMAPDWSGASMTMFETDMGSPILQAILKPKGRKAKSFKTTDEVVNEALRVLTTGR